MLKSDKVGGAKILRASKKTYYFTKKIIEINECMSTTTETQFEDIKWVIRIRKLKKNRQHNGQKKKDKQRSTKHTHNNKDRVTRTSLKTGGKLRCSGMVFLFHMLDKMNVQYIH